MVVSNDIYEQALKNHDNKMIMHTAAVGFLSSLDKDELHRCKLMALWKALQRWDSTKGGSFTTLLFKQVQWECLQAINANNKHKCLNMEVVDRETLPDTGFSEILECVPDDLKDIVEKRFVYNMTLMEIADLCGYSHETIRKRLLRAIDCLKDTLHG